MKILATAQDWEIVDDDADGLGSFIYKRPRREAPPQPLALTLPAPEPIAESDDLESEQEALQRKKDVLLQRKKVYDTELKKWEELFSKQEEVIASVESPKCTVTDSSMVVTLDEGDVHYEPYEELLDQVQDLEWLIRKHTNFCEQAEDMCRILDEEVKYDTLELPSPRHIFESLLLP